MPLGDLTTQDVSKSMSGSWREGGNLPLCRLIMVFRGGTSGGIESNKQPVRNTNFTGIKIKKKLNHRIMYSDTTVVDKQSRIPG